MINGYLTNLVIGFHRNCKYIGCSFNICFQCILSLTIKFDNLSRRSNYYDRSMISIDYFEQHFKNSNI